MEKQFPKIAFWKTAALLLACLAAILLLLYVAELLPVTYVLRRNLLQSAAAIILTSGIISIVTNVLIRHELASFWLEAIGIKDSFDRAGLNDIGLDFHAFDFRTQIENAKNIQLCVIYANTWVNTHFAQITSFLRKPGTTLTVCLLDENCACLPSLAESFGRTADELRQQIKATISFFKNEVKKVSDTGAKGCHVKLYVHNRPPKHTYYRFDNLHVLVPYNVSQGRAKIPVFVFATKQGGVSDFLQSDFTDLTLRHSVLIFDSEGTTNAT